jgi:TupA-like ATPgrasp
VFLSVSLLLPCHAGRVKLSSPLHREGKLLRTIANYLEPHLNDKAFIYQNHFRAHRRLPDLVKQSRFTDRMAFRRLYPSPIFTPLSDKVQVRDYVTDQVGEKYLIPLLAVTTDIEGFSFDDLPSSFAMKASHGSKWNELVRDKSKVDIEALRSKARGWLSQNYYTKLRERHYREIRPRILFETLLLDEGQLPKDYKVHCFRNNGKLTQIVQVVSDRFQAQKANYFTNDWSPIDMDQGFSPIPNELLPRPEALDELLSVSEKLSGKLNYVRVDMYLINNRIYFGEMSFTPNAGLLRFRPDTMDERWGELFEADQPQSMQT